MLRLQMRFMCWDMVIEHRNNHCLVDVDYFSHVGADLCYDPLLRNYIQQVAALRRRSPAPTETYLNGAIGIRMPSRDFWVKSYTEDPELLAVLKFVQNPGTISQRSLEAAKLDPNYQQALQQSSIHLDRGILFYHEPIAGSKSFAKLQLVPLALRNIVFVAFHSNPLGGCLKFSRTFHCICLRFYWPQMYKYISKLCRSCPGCALTNPTKGKAREVWNTTSPSKHHVWCCISVAIKPAPPLDSRGFPIISSRLAGCVHLRRWSRLQMRTPVPTYRR